MADKRMIAALGDRKELGQLEELVDELVEAEAEKLSRQTYANPEHYDRIAWEKLRARHDGMKYVFKLVVDIRADLYRKENAK